MKIFNNIILVIIVLLSLAAGAAKLMQAPQEMEFLLGLGLNETLVMLLGALQILGGILLAIPKTRKVGAILTLLLFLLSSVFIFMSGNIPFALFSLIPVALAAYLFYVDTKRPEYYSDLIKKTIP